MSDGFPKSQGAGLMKQYFIVVKNNYSDFTPTTSLKCVSFSWWESGCAVQIREKSSK